MANRQDSVPFSISYLMKSGDSKAVTSQSITPPPCYLDGSLPAALSQDVPRTSDIALCSADSARPELENNTSVEVSQGQRGATRRPDEILSPPATPVSVTSPSPVCQTHLPQTLCQTPTYTDLSHHRPNLVNDRSHRSPPFSLDFLLGAGLPPLPGHQTIHNSFNTQFAEMPDSTAEVGSVVAVDKKPASSKTSKGSKSRVVSPLGECPRSKRNRTSYTQNQLRQLENVFLTTPYPDCQLYESLADELGVPQKNLKTWFQNKRARSKRKSADKKPALNPYCMPPYPVSVSPTFHPYAMPVTTISPGTTTTSSSSMITPPPSPNPHQLLKQPISMYSPSSVSTRHSIISPPRSSSGSSSLPHSGPRTNISHRFSPPAMNAKTQQHGVPSCQPGSFTGLCHDRLYYAEFRDLHESVIQETPPPVYPSMLSALEKLCSSLPSS